MNLRDCEGVHITIARLLAVCRYRTRTNTLDVTMNAHSITAVAAPRFVGAGRRLLMLDLAGPVCLRDAAGTDLTPKARKAQGLLALIGCSPKLRRSRSWVQDKLWSDRGQEQGAASLRQCLTEIRTALGPNSDCLKAEAGWVSFDPARVHVCLEPTGPSFGEECEFAEGLDIRDPEFECWLRDQRQRFLERGHIETAGLDRDRGDTMRRPNGSSGRSLRPTVGLAASHDPVSEGAEGPVSDFVLDLMARSLLEGAFADVIDLRAHTDVGSRSDYAAEPDWLLSVASSVYNDRVRVSVCLSQTEGNRVRWADAATFDMDELYTQDQSAIGGLLGRTTGVLHQHIARAWRPVPEATPAFGVPASRVQPVRSGSARMHS
jgi:hypothetical protein